MENNMKQYFFIILLLILLSCSFENNNPLENDDLLKNAPTISNILFEQNNGFVLYLAKSYPQNYTLHFERKADVAFIPITLKKINEATYADTSFSIEHDYNFMYRVRVEKDGFFSDFSNEKGFQYISTTLFAPTNLLAISVELQGLQLNWQDNSGNETGYKIEKNENGAGFQELATLPANSQTYFDEIPGMPETPLNLIYRVRAFSNSMTSDWQSQTIVYSGLGAPTNLLITNNSFYNFTIEWTRNSVIATGYDVERKQDENPYALLATVASSVNTYSDFLDEIGTYFYRVRAVKDGIYSSYTNTVNQIVDSVLPMEGLVAYYPFNGNANDESGNGNHGTVNGATLTEDRFGNENSAYSFDGSSNYVNCYFSPQSIFCISIWYWAEENQNNNVGIVSTYSGGFNYGGFYVGVSGYTAWVRTDNNVVNYFSTTPFTWKHLFLKSDGTNVQVFIDNVKILDFQATTNHSNTIVFADSRYNGRYFKGYLDDIRIFNRVLSEQEIQALYHEGGWE
jgi:hypothetical protein